MTENENDSKNVALSVPTGALAAVVLLGLAAAAYTLLNRGEEEEGASGSGSGQKSSRGGGMRKKLGLMALITLIENDATRKVLVAALRAIAKRT